MVKNPPANAGDMGDLGLVPGLGISPDVGHGKQLLEKSMDREKPGRLQSIGSQRVGHD